MNHAKAVVFDQSVALCGSPNLDSRSLLLNYESAVVFYGAEEIEWLARWIQALIPGSLAFDNRAPSLWRDVSEGLLLDRRLSVMRSRCAVPAAAAAARRVGKRLHRKPDPS